MIYEKYVKEIEKIKREQEEEEKKVLVNKENYTSNRESPCRRDHMR